MWEQTLERAFHLQRSSEGGRLTDWPWKLFWHHSFSHNRKPDCGEGVAWKGALEGGELFQNAFDVQPCPSLTYKNSGYLSRAGGQAQKRRPAQQSAVAPAWVSAAFVLTQNDTHQHFQHESGWWSVKLSFCMKLNGSFFKEQKRCQRPVSNVKEKNLAEMCFCFYHTFIFRLLSTMLLGKSTIPNKSFHRDKDFDKVKPLNWTESNWYVQFHKREWIMSEKEGASSSLCLLTSYPYVVLHLISTLCEQYWSVDLLFVWFRLNELFHHLPMVRLLLFLCPTEWATLCLQCG